ncbi:hypothetical protein [Aeromonas caviae]|uniref:hypothetical protein n=1 Tax=Aeromonas caviae TaxID=648 RepID=UPI002B47CC12|nr:hypothetical protein [Aeromonas caviae]
MTTNRISFKHTVLDTLYRKSGGRCSFPRCKNPTMGPSINEDGPVINMGVACHIYSASPGGPRGQGGKDTDFLSSEKNGIWCCNQHAALIDKNNGKDYPAEDLFAWKKLAEARTQKQMTDMPSPFGWVSSIKFTKLESIKNPPKINLSRRTFIFGRNCSGKSSLMELAASIGQSKYSTRFQRVNSVHALNCETTDVEGYITYTTVDTLSKNFTIKITNGIPTRFDETTQCLLPPGDIAVIYCSSHENRFLHNEDHVDFFTRYLNVDEGSLISLIKHRTNTLLDGEIKIVYGEKEDDDYDPPKKIRRKKEDGEYYKELHFRHTGRPYWVPYERLSHSEKGMLLLDLALAAAREISKQRLTLFMIDDLIYYLDDCNFKKYIESLSEGDFQVLSIIPPKMEDYILEKKGTNISLKELDYLTSWKLQETHHSI